MDGIGLVLGGAGGLGFRTKVPAYRPRSVPRSDYVGPSNASSRRFERRDEKTVRYHGTASFSSFSIPTTLTPPSRFLFPSLTSPIR